MSAETLSSQMEERTLLRFVRALFEWLTAPHHTLTDELSQRRAQLLSTMTFVVTMVASGIFIYQLIRYPNLFQSAVTWLLLVGIVLCFGTYLLSRAGRINLAAKIFIGTLYVAFSILPFFPAAPFELAFFSVLTILMTAVFFSLRATMQISVLVVLTIIAIGLATQFEYLVWVMQYMLMACAVIFVFITHLRFQERLRAAALEEINAKLRASEESLEHRVQERTRDLQVAADVSLQITTVLDRATLLADVAERTASAFGLYHVSIFLHDEKTGILKLHQGVGEVGARMIEMGKQFTLEDAGLVPQAARTRTPASASDTNLDASYIPNPLLPDTRSELAIPMLYRGMLIGVLDLQSEQEGRFQADDVRILRTLADQIAIAVRNSQLFEETTAALAQAERANAVKSTFLSSMSHELRTPMNAIINFTKFVAKGSMGPVNAQQVETLGEVIDSAKHLLNLINDVLDMSKIEAGSLKLFVEDNIDLNGILRSIQSTARSLLADRPVGLATDIAEFPPISGDKQRIMQILLNVMSNACKFTEQGLITIRAYQEDDEAIIAVTDTGPGIAEADHHLVFEAFKQTETGLRQAGGTGLGMPISRSLAEAHGGRLWLESSLGKGATFYVALPLKATVEAVR